MSSMDERFINDFKETIILQQTIYDKLKVLSKEPSFSELAFKFTCVSPSILSKISMAIKRDDVSAYFCIKLVLRRPAAPIANAYLYPLCKRNHYNYYLVGEDSPVGVGFACYFPASGGVSFFSSLDLCIDELASRLSTGR